jgi:hypothetical protein
VWLPKFKISKANFQSDEVELWVRSSGIFPLRCSTCPSMSIRSSSMWHHPMCHHYPMGYPVFLPSCRHLVICKHPYDIHTKSNVKELLFLWIQHFIFFPSTIYISTLKRSYLQSLIRFYGVTSCSRYPLVEIIFYENQDGIFFSWGLLL